jgi:hypothetical protein
MPQELQADVTLSEGERTATDTYWLYDEGVTYSLDDASVFALTPPDDLVNEDGLVDDWPLGPVDPTAYPLFTILRALSKPINSLADDVDTLHTNAFLDEASDRELAQFARAVDLSRRANEDDNSLRTRVGVRRLALASDSSIDDFGDVLDEVFGTDTSNIRIESPGTTRNINVTLSSALLDDIPLTQSELEGELERATAAGTEVAVVTRGAFRLDGPGYTPPANSGLNDGELL